MNIDQNKSYSIRQVSYSVTHPVSYNKSRRENYDPKIRSNSANPYYYLMC